MEPITPQNIDQQIKLLELKTAHSPSRKPWLIPVSIGLIILIVLGTLSVGAMANLKSKAPVQLPTTDWKTYTSTPHQFTFKYPPQWLVEDNTATSPQYALSLTLTSPDYKTQEANRSNNLVTTKLTGSRLTITIDPTFYYSNFNQFQEAESRRNTTIINIGGIQALYFPADSLSRVSSTASTSFLRAPKKATRPHLYRAALTFPTKQNLRYTALFDQILSTFYFPPNE